jgi:protease-4
MFSHSDSEIISSTWALSEQHAQAWLFMVAQILQGKQLPQAPSTPSKESQIEMRRFIVDGNGDYINRNEHPNTPEGSIGVVQIAGPMVKYGSWSNWGSDELVFFAEQFDRDPNIIGQIWLMETPGGTMTSIAPYLEFLKKKSKPVIGLADICASAGLYVGVATDKLYARNNISAMFGSVGVMATIVDYTEYLKNLGVKEHAIYSSVSSFKNKSSKEALKGDYSEFRKEHLDPLAIQFQNFVKQSCPNLKTDVEGILKGKMFYAEEAKEHGLISGIADFEEAAEQVKFLAGARSFMFQ